MKPTKQPTAYSLRELRERSGLSDSIVAAKLGYCQANEYRQYEDLEASGNIYLPADLVCRLLPILTGRGKPPITRQEVARLAGPQRIKTLDNIMGENDQFWQSAELRPGQALLKLNRVVTVDQFLRIMAVLNETDADDD